MQLFYCIFLIKGGQFILGLKPKDFLTMNFKNIVSDKPPWNAQIPVSREA
jgi:hypothetical protein